MNQRSEIPWFNSGLQRKLFQVNRAAVVDLAGGMARLFRNCQIWKESQIFNLVKVKIREYVFFELGVLEQI